MPWTTPKTNWKTGELVAASDMNAIGENLAALKQPVTVLGTTAEDISKTVGEFVDVDSDNLNLTITTTGGDVLAHFHGSVGLSGGREARFDIEVDGTRLGGDDGILLISYNNAREKGVRQSVSVSHLIQNLSAGSHTFKVQVKTRSYMSLSAGAQFWVREL